MKRRNVTRPLLKTVALLTAATAFQIVIATSASAVGLIYLVNATSDSGHDTAPGDGICETGIGNGVCTLRAAIEEANGHAGTDGIRFSIPTSDPGYDAQTVIWTITLQSVLPDISTAMNITGPNANAVAVQPKTSFRVFNVTTFGTVNLSGLTIANGYGIANDSPGGGGAVQNVNSGTVTITNCTLSNNIGDSAGAIYNVQNGTVNVTNSTLQFNSTEFGSGGGIGNAIGTINCIKQQSNS